MAPAPPRLGHPAPVGAATLVGMLHLLFFACSPADSGRAGPANDSAADTAPADTAAAAVDHCDRLGLTVRPWVDAPDDATLYATAADLTLPTREGDWTFSTAWTGCEVYLFIQEDPRQNQGFDKGIWERDGREFLEALPPNAHAFFLPSGRTEEEQTAALDLITDKLDRTLDNYDADTAADYWRRLHFVTERDSTLPGWLGDNMRSPAWGVGVDRFQRIRYVGSYADPSRYDANVGWFEPNLGMATNEAIYYNFEAARQDQLDADGATVVSAFEGQQGGNAYDDVDIPAIDAFDTLSVDLTMGCIGEGEYGTCPAWDYMAYAYLCDDPASDENPYADTACAPGETLAGACVSPTGSERGGTYTCNETGTGYGALACDSCDTEIARWITTYHREGRWVHDISPVLPLFAKGGSRRVRFYSDNSYDLTFALRFSNTGKGVVPQHVSAVLVSENTDTFAVPAAATRVELATVISQHGQTCGEFCDAEHHFLVNGDTAAEVVRSFPESGTELGCMEQVTSGTVPNQYGTWWYGRSGWCPGKDVPTVAHDITASVVIGGDNTLEYWTVGDAGSVRRAFWVVSSW